MADYPGYRWPQEYQAWKARRIELSAQEATADPPGNEWWGSDDAAVDLLDAAAGLFDFTPYKPLDKLTPWDPAWPPVKITGWDTLDWINDLVVHLEIGTEEGWGAVNSIEAICLNDHLDGPYVRFRNELGGEVSMDDLYTYPDGVDPDDFQDRLSEALVQFIQACEQAAHKAVKVGRQIAYDQLPMLLTPASVCRNCREPVEFVGQWRHAHADHDTYCGTGDGSTAYPEDEPNPYVARVTPPANAAEAAVLIDRGDIEVHHAECGPTGCVPGCDYYGGPHA